MVGTPMRMGMEACTVSELMTQELSGWDEEFVRNVFDVHDANDILNMPLVNTNKSDEMEKMIAVLWSIWKEQNNRVWRGEKNTAGWVVSSGLDGLHEWQAVRRREENGGRDRRSRCTLWHPPDPGELKCNVDYAVFEAEHKSGWGVVVRDSGGQLIKIGMQAREGVLVPCEGEGMALLLALRRMEADGFERVTFSFVVGPDSALSAPHDGSRSSRGLSKDGLSNAIHTSPTTALPLASTSFGF
ncbi:hypothetical protein LINPERHAP1_LOCUS19652 [Linum perenne]